MRRAPASYVAGWGFFSSVGGMDSQEDSASAVSPGLLVSLVIGSHSLGSRSSLFVP